MGTGCLGDCRTPLIAKYIAIGTWAAISSCQMWAAVASSGWGAVPCKATKISTVASAPKDMPTGRNALGRSSIVDEFISPTYDVAGGVWGIVATIKHSATTRNQVNVAHRHCLRSSIRGQSAVPAALRPRDSRSAPVGNRPASQSSFRAEAFPGLAGLVAKHPERAPSSCWAARLAQSGRNEAAYAQSTRRQLNRPVGRGGQPPPQPEPQLHLCIPIEGRNIGRSRTCPAKER